MLLDTGHTLQHILPLIVRGDNDANSFKNKTKRALSLADTFVVSSGIPLFVEPGAFGCAPAFAFTSGFPY